MKPRRIPPKVQKYRVANQGEARKSLAYFRAMILTDSSNRSTNDLTQSDKVFRRVSDG